MSKLPYRQGDVALMPTTIPATAKEVRRKQGERLVVRHGEATGHAHAFYGPKVKMFREDGSGGVSYRVLGDHPAGAMAATMVADEAHAFLAETPLGLVKFDKQHATFADDVIETATPFSLLTHDEHHAHAIPAGDYTNPPQREYAPEEIRIVAD